MADEYEDFWWALFRCGETEEKRRWIWNHFIVDRYDIGRIAPNMDRKEFDKQLNIKIISNRDLEPAEKLVRKYGAPPVTDEIGPSVKSFMTFASQSFEERVSFAGRVLIGANFGGQVFEKGADFSDTIFLGFTNFEDTEFAGPAKQLHDGYWFSKSSFHYIANFKRAKFRSQTTFDRVVFHRDAVFQFARFEPPDGDTAPPGAMTNFQESRFDKEADFKNAVFKYKTDFSHAAFHAVAKFDAAEFCNATTFNNAGFKGTTSFRKAIFNKPPKFFETELHEDVDFSRVDWKGAEQSYHRSYRRRDPQDAVEQDAGDAVRAWDRLALIMSQREKSPERHKFFRLKMRALRQRDGYNFSSLVNCLFDVISDYGWGIRRAFSWWFVHVASGALILGAAAEVDRVWIVHGHWPIVRDSLLVSFANAHAFLGLALPCP